MAKALIIVDVQNDFCEGGSLAVAGGAAVAGAIEEHLRACAGEYDAVVATQDWHIEPGAHFSAEPDFVDSWPPHCVAGTPGAEPHPGLAPALAAGRVDAFFRKGRYEAAYSGFEARLAASAGGTTADGTGATTADSTGATTADSTGATAAEGSGPATAGEPGPDDPVPGEPLAEWLHARGVDEVEIVGIATDYCVRATALDAVDAGFSTALLAPLTAAVHPENFQAVLKELRGAGVEIHAS